MDDPTDTTPALALTRWAGQPINALRRRPREPEPRPTPNVLRRR